MRHNSTNPSLKPTSSPPSDWPDSPLRFEDLSLSKAMLAEVKDLLVHWHDRNNRRLTLMEVCGTHTVALSKSGIRDTLRPWLDLRSGPGCPVCVTDQEDIDTMLALAALPGVTVTTFGDMMRVPGTRGDLARAKAAGADVRMVYSPLEAVAIATGEPQREVIFMGIGFETTVPTVATAIRQAVEKDLRNFSVFSVHKLAAPVIRQLLQDPELRLDGLILPGHVAAITGRRHFDFIAKAFSLPAAVTGFAALDLLAGIRDLLHQVLDQHPRVSNCYSRVVREDGNPKAWALVETFFEPGRVKWRGLNELPASGLVLRPEYAAWDARQRFTLDLPPSQLPMGCLCGEVLKGKALPFDCPHFTRSCTPIHPVGPCMVSGEGTCAAYYKYERRDDAANGSKS
ncbi:MAG: hydrogenase formation protein HypD [Desulfitobacteriaceae bacterium]|nr:hydrogenase formation protein HypD [Desulfitobacteriaceae bacterium]MDI6878456.1 hydrogenase formation protein HypD [Desulfitobacteriaceae bacterium]MDI6913025.1 hydrogenase formation protein HypD [Desulfitobacteriaceae bacterium]